jgi:hypothetical protein
MLGQHSFKVHAWNFGVGDGQLGAISGALLGPTGLLAGGQGKRIVLTLQFSDGRKLLGRADGAAFTARQAATFPTKGMQ